MLVTGGDLTVNGVRNFSNSKVNLFTPANNTLTASGTMNYPRWYPSITTLHNGDKLVLGGRPSPDDVGNQGEPTPEVRSATSGWRTLSGISLISNTLEWFYPKGFVGFDGAVILLENSGAIFRLTTDGAGTMQDTGSRTAYGVAYYPSVMFAPFKVLTVRAGQRAQVVDISSVPPVVTDVPNLIMIVSGGTRLCCPMDESSSRAAPVSKTSSPTSPIKRRSLIRTPELPELGRSAHPLQSPVFIILRRCSFQTGRC